jgi:hypothetical protein
MQACPANPAYAIGSQFGLPHLSQSALTCINIRQDGYRERILLSG